MKSFSNTDLRLRLRIGREIRAYNFRKFS